MLNNNKDIEFKRNLEVAELFKLIDEPVIKVVIGLRRAGKSYLLNTLFFNALIDKGYSSNSILKMDLSGEYDYIRSPNTLKESLNKLVSKDLKFVFIDEIQLAGDGYSDVLISFMKQNSKVNIYVTGSNSKTLSDDIRKAFKENGVAIFLRPLSYLSVCEAMPNFSIEEYFKYGSLPIVLKKPENERFSFLKNDLYKNTYLSDIRDRVNTQYLSNQEKENIIVRIASNMMTPLSQNKIINGILSSCRLDNDKKLILKREILDFIAALSSSFLFVDFNDGATLNPKTPKDFLDHNIKKYCFDIGILNVISSAEIFKKNSSILENAVFLELYSRNIQSEGTYVFGKKEKKYGIDFTFTRNEIQFFIQTTFVLQNSDKEREIDCFLFTPIDSKKIIVYKENLLITIPNYIQHYYIDSFFLSFDDIISR